MSFLYDLMYGTLLLFLWPYLWWRLRHKEAEGVGWGDYFGRGPSRPVSATCVWIHGVSLGEINAAQTLVSELRRRAPETVLAISSTTKTGLTRAREIYSKHFVFRFPLDVSPAIRAVLKRVRPSAIVLMELETWPNMIEVARAQHIPVIIANGRVTEERTMRVCRRPLVRSAARRMFRQIQWVGAQDETYGDRFIQLGVPADRVEIAGSLKYDVAEVGESVEGQRELAEAMGIDADRPLLVCGSTGPGEEELLLRVYRDLLKEFSGLQLAIIPRKPERFDEVAELVVNSGFACLRRSSGAPTFPAGIDEPRPVFLGDTMGELRKFYGLSTLVFVGRTFVPMGGSDVMEVAGLAKPILLGPHTENFAEPVALLNAAGACRQLSTPEGLTAALKELLRHPERAQRMGTAGRTVVLSRRGATERIVTKILELMHTS